MAKFRKKPVVIEAFQITEVTTRDNRDWPNWLNEAWQKGLEEPGGVSRWHPFTGDGPLLVVTLEGQVKCDIGDWIIKGVKGELYPCKPDIFTATYEEVVPTEAEIQAALDFGKTVDQHLPH